MLLATIQLISGARERRLSNMSFQGNLSALGSGGDLIYLNYVVGALAQTLGPYIVYEVVYGVSRGNFGTRNISSTLGYIASPSISYIINNNSEFNPYFPSMVGCKATNIIWWG